MSIYWVTTKNRETGENRRGCVVLTMSELTENEKEKLSAKGYVEARLGVEVLTMETLPYAATPLLLGSDVTFCFTPQECEGRTSCPRGRSCCD